MSHFFKHGNIYICFSKADISENELELVLSYWELQPNEPKKFKHDAFKLARKHGYRQHELSALIAQKYPVSGASKKFHCLVCGANHLAFSRNQYIKIPIKGRLCDKCERQEISITKQKKDEFNKNFVDKYYCSDYSLEQLDYLECIYLYLQLKQKNLDDSKSKITVLNSDGSILGSDEWDEKLRFRLVAKGVVLFFDNIPESFFEQYDQNRISLEHLNFCLRSNNGFPFQHHQLFLELSNKIKNYSLKNRDFEDIRNVVIANKLSNLYRLINSLESEYRISVKRNQKLNYLLTHLARNYPVSIIFFTMHSKAKEVVVAKHRTMEYGYELQHLFTKKLEEYISSVETNNWELKYTKSVEGVIQISELEMYVCQNLLPSNLNWTPLSGDEVISLWVKALENNGYFGES